MYVTCVSKRYNVFYKPKCYFIAQFYFWGRGQLNVYKNPNISDRDFNFVLNQSRGMGQVFGILILTLH